MEKTFKVFFKEVGSESEYMLATLIKARDEEELIEKWLNEYAAYGDYDVIKVEEYYMN